MVSFAIERFIEEANQAKSPEEVSRLFADALKFFGYDRFCYSLITPHPSVGLNAQHGVQCNFSDDWMQYYAAKEYLKIDPVVRAAGVTRRPILWNSLLPACTAEQKKLMDEAAEARLLDGIAIPIYGAHGEIAGVSMASSVGGVRPDKNVLCKLQAIFTQFHLVHTELSSNNRSQDDFSGAVHLTAREKEILSWAAEGKSDSVIGEIIGVSHSTVRFHMNNVFKKLQANERTLATVKAVRHGLILPSYLG